MTDKPSSPVARHIIAKCGGAKRVSELTGRSLVTIYKWHRPRSEGGTGGLVPTEVAATLMRAALRGEVDLTPADFFDLTPEHPSENSQAAR